MLKSLLDRLAAGGTWTVESLAEQLDVTPALVKTMLDDLARRGYLQPLPGGCSGACASCAMSKSCVQHTDR